MKVKIYITLFLISFLSFGQSETEFLSAVLMSEDVKEFLADKIESNIAFESGDSFLIWQNNQFVAETERSTESMIQILKLEKDQPKSKIKFSINNEVFAKAKVVSSNDMLKLKSIGMKTKGSKMKSKMIAWEF